MSFRERIDDAFRGAGSKPGLEIWCMQQQQGPVPIPKSSHGKFFSGNSYIVLSTVALKSGIRQHDIHYWLGTDAKEVDIDMASDKALELDAALGSRAVQYREVQGYETEKFLSYFKPCIIPFEGLFSSQLQGVGSGSYPITLLACRGDHVVHVRQVPFSRSSLNHNEVFILNTQSKIFLFSGCNSTTQERAKALDVLQYIKENQHGGRCEVATIEDGKLVADSDAGEFWSLFGGYAPIARDSSLAHQEEAKISAAKLFWSYKGRLSPVDAPALDRGMLSSDKCYVLDCDAEIFLWMGRTTLVTERKESISSIEGMVHSQGRSTNTCTTFLTEGSETSKFISYFSGWPQIPPPSLYEEGREKVAAIFKHQGFDVKEYAEEDHSEPSIDRSGILKVWLVNGHDVSLVQAVGNGKLYSGDCYIVQYTYPGIGRDHDLFYAWHGRNSTLEDRTNVISLMRSMVNLSKGCPVMAQIFEGKEPDLFFRIFQSVIILKGGLSTGYKTSISRSENSDATYDTYKTALFRIQGSGDTMQAIQVDLVSASLNSSYCYILQDGSSTFTWTGSLSSQGDQDILDRMLYDINPTKQHMSVREGSEPDDFWNVLGAKSEYPKEKDKKNFTEDPQLFVCLSKEGDFKWKEIYNFSQDDLTTEDVFVLDFHDEIYVWVGQHANSSLKDQAFSIGKKFLEMDILLEGFSADTAIYIISEGNEPPIFTRFFDWDFSKSCMHGNSYERKLTILKGSTTNVEMTDRGLQKSYGVSSPEYTLRHTVRKYSISDGSNMRNRSHLPSASADLNASNSRFLSVPTAAATEHFVGSNLPDHKMSADPLMSSHLAKDSVESLSVIEELGSCLITAEVLPVEDTDKSEVEDEVETFPYELLNVSSTTLIESIDVTKREAYLSKEDFEEKFGMSKKSFYKLPKWRQNKLKMELGLF